MSEQSGVGRPKLPGVRVYIKLSPDLIRYLDLVQREWKMATRADAHRAVLLDARADYRLLLSQASIQELNQEQD